MTNDIFKGLPPPEVPAEESIRRILVRLVEVDKELISVTDSMKSIMKLPRRPKGLREERMGELINRKIILEDERNACLNKIKFLQQGLPKSPYKS